MKIVFGTPPVVIDPELAQDGWRSFHGLGAKAIQTYGLAVGCAGMLFLSTLFRGKISPHGPLMELLILILTLPLHELIHAFATPAWGFSDRTIIGLQSGKNLMLPYMYFDGTQPVWRFLLTGLAPMMVLTVIPVVFILFVPLDSALRADLSFLAFFNVATSGGDLVNFFCVITRLPLGATVKGNGWGLLWKE